MVTKRRTSRTKTTTKRKVTSTGRKPRKVASSRLFHRLRSETMKRRASSTPSPTARGDTGQGYTLRSETAKKRGFKRAFKKSPTKRLVKKSYPTNNIGPISSGQKPVYGRRFNKFGKKGVRYYKRNPDGGGFFHSHTQYNVEPVGTGRWEW